MSNSGLKVFGDSLDEMVLFESVDDEAVLVSDFVETVELSEVAVFESVLCKISDITHFEVQVSSEVLIVPFILREVDFS